MLYAASIDRGKTVVVLTMRADFYSKCAGYGTLAAALSDHQVLVGPMTDEELRQAIQRPAQLVGCELEDGLVEALINDFNNQPGALPLLQHALSELWEGRKDRWLTRDAYQAIGKLEGALENYANSVFEKFNENEKEVCRRIFLRLTQPGEGTEDTKRRASVQELIPADAEDEPTFRVIHDFIRNPRPIIQKIAPTQTRGSSQHAPDRYRRPRPAMTPSGPQYQKTPWVPL